MSNFQAPIEMVLGYIDEHANDMVACETFLCDAQVPAVMMGPGDLRMGVHGVKEV